MSYNETCERFHSIGHEYLLDGLCDACVQAEIATLRTSLTERIRALETDLNSSHKAFQELDEQMGKLTHFIADNMPGEVPCPEYIIDCAIRIMREQKAKLIFIKDAVCGKCGRSLPPDGDCYGCAADRLQIELATAHKDFDELKALAIQKIDLVATAGMKGIDAVLANIKAMPQIRLPRMEKEIRLPLMGDTEFCAKCHKKRYGVDDPGTFCKCKEE